MTEPLSGGGGAYLWRLRPYFGRVRGQLLLGSAGGLVSNLAAALPAVAVGDAIDRALAYEAGGASAADVAVAALGVVGAALAVELPKMVKRWWLNVAWARMRADLRADAYEGVLALPPPEEVAAGDAVSRVVNDVEVVAAGFGEVVFETWDTLLLSVALAGWLMVLDPGLAAWALLPLPAALVASLLAGRWVSARTARSRVAAGALADTMAELLHALPAVRAGGLVGAATERVRERSVDQAGAQLRVARVEEAAAPLAGVCLGAGTALALWQGGLAVERGALTVGALVAFLQLHLRFVERAPRLARMVTRLRAGGAAHRRLRPLLELPLPPTEPVASGTRARRPAAVHLASVTFTHPGATSPALDGLSLDIPAGALVAVAGPMGSGKTALCRLLAGVAVPDAGSVLVGGGTPGGSGGEPATAVGYLPQNSPLFAGTMEENVLGWGRDDRDGAEPASPETLLTALEVAGIDGDERATLLSGRPHGVGQRGGQVSGGQRQRIALARALAGHGSIPGLLVLDDPFSAVDVLTEQRILERLRAAVGPGADASRRATVVATSNRPALLAWSDFVVVLEGGRITEVGTYEELVARGTFYSGAIAGPRPIGDTLAASASHAAEAG